MHIMFARVVSLDSIDWLNAQRMVYLLHAPAPYLSSFPNAAVG